MVMSVNTGPFKSRFQDRIRRTKDVGRKITIKDRERDRNVKEDREESRIG
jgi:hypothetical protein